MAFYTELIGFAAGFLTTVALVPQAVKSWKTKSTKDVSLGWVSILTIGVFLWLVYGLLIKSWPLVAANIFTFILAFTILVFKLKYK